jgi:hypothetical protein
LRILQLMKTLSSRWKCGKDNTIVKMQGFHGMLARSLSCVESL